MGDRLVFYYEVEEGDHGPDFDEYHVATVAAYGCLRHIQALESGAASDTRTLAVGVRHHEQFGRRYAFALYDGRTPPMNVDTRRALEADHGVYDFGRSRIGRPRIGRNEACPCGSGRKFKHCCQSLRRCVLDAQSYGCQFLDAAAVSERQGPGLAPVQLVDVAAAALALRRWRHPLFRLHLTSPKRNMIAVRPLVALTGVGQMDQGWMTQQGRRVGRDRRPDSLIVTIEEAS